MAALTPAQQKALADTQAAADLLAFRTAQYKAAVARAANPDIGGEDFGYSFHPLNSRVKFNGTVTGGTYTITFNANTTTALAYNAGSAAVKTALEALANVLIGSATVTGVPSSGMVVKFDSRIAAGSLVVNSSLTGTGVSVTVTDLNT